MLLSPLYHRVGNGKDANPLTFFEKHFSWIQNRFESVHPGDPLKTSPSICLTFDDALFDFYYYLFPLLKKFQLKAVLSVPTAFIPEKVVLSSKERLNQIQPLSPKVLPRPSPAHCSWDELREMHESSLIHIASHSVSHSPLTSKSVDLKKELLDSKARLEKELQAPITTFVYPYGKFNSFIHERAKKHYSYIMRIGNALNFSWQNRHQLFYRINADSLFHYQSPFTRTRRFQYLLRYFVNIALKK